MGRIHSLVMRNVTRRFGAATALEDFTLEIAGGSFVTLLGPSGCGKTTALNCLAGLLDLSAGEILLDGAPIHLVPAEKRGFGMVFQSYALFPHLTAGRNVGYGMEIRGVRRAERERRIRRALEMVHLEDFAKRYPAQLSGGQQQRLAIARTIVLEPSLLLLDEPLSNLDANLRTEMRIEIKRIHAELGLTTLYVTHDQSEAMSMSDVVVVMRAGRIEQIGAPREIYTQPRSLYVANFMGYANRLPAAVLGREGDFYAVRTTGGERLLAASPSGTDLAAGQAVTLCYRPDEALADPPQEGNHLRGQAQLVEYLGKSFETLLTLPGEGGTQALVHSPQAPTVGAPVTFGVRPDRLLAFPTGEVPTPAVPIAGLNGAHAASQAAPELTEAR
jgi:putative spermidine/putrescine transport system ATP-binding protein